MRLRVYWNNTYETIEVKRIVWVRVDNGDLLVQIELDKEPFYQDIRATRILALE